MKKQFLLLFFLLSAVFRGQGQVQLVSGAFTSAGGSESSDVSFDFALGQTFSMPYDGAALGSEGVLQVVRLLSTNTESYTLEGVSVFPNPTNHILHVEADCSSIYDVRIFDSSGRLLASVLEFSCERDLDFSNYKTGLYLVQISSQEAQSVFKINKL